MNVIAPRRTFLAVLMLVLSLIVIQSAGAQGQTRSLQPRTTAQALQTFLPLVVQIAAPPPPTGLINGNFEAGGEAWVEYSEQGYEIILSTDWLPITPRSGVWAAWLGGVEDEVSLLGQLFTVPAGANHLAYYLWIASEDVCNVEYDIGGLVMDDDENVTEDDILDAYLLCEGTSTGGWVRREVDITRYAGKEVILTFSAFTDSTLNSNMFIDDVSLNTAPLQPDLEAPALVLSPVPHRTTLPFRTGEQPLHEMDRLKALFRSALDKSE